MKVLLPSSKLDAKIYVDEEDLPVILKHGKKWGISSHGYPRRISKITKKWVYLHRIILEANSTWVDHVDGDPLNNCRENLRLCSPQQNCWHKKKYNGKSKYKGVGWNNKLKKWIAYICVDKKLFHLGVFFNEEEAAIAYDAEAKLAFGEFAVLNFPDNKA